MKTLEMMKFAVLLVFLGIAVSASGQASEALHSDKAARAIKALSDNEVRDLRAGRGMGMALAAELNGYPGPRHVLDLADRLGLSDPQRQRVRGLFNRMEAEAAKMGREIVESERELDRLFAEGQATDGEVERRTAALGARYGALRNVHLRYHLIVREILTSRQIALYSRLRGYTDASPHSHGSHH